MTDFMFGAMVGAILVCCVAVATGTKESWDANPFVCVIEFERIKP